MNRRSFIAGLLAMPAVVPIVNLMKLRGVVIPPDIEMPSWVPTGWIVPMGQTINRFQFPALFNRIPGVVAKTGRPFIPLYDGMTKVKLDECRPVALNPYTRVDRDALDEVPVTIMSTQLMWNAAGRPAKPGMYAKIMVPRETFEASFGPVEPYPW
jgi:hypothetical protein